MLAVAKLSETKWLSPWVIFCAVACIGVGVGTGASGGSFNNAEVSGFYVPEGYLHCLRLSGVQCPVNARYWKREERAATQRKQTAV